MNKICKDHFQTIIILGVLLGICFFFIIHSVVQPKTISQEFDETNQIIVSYPVEQETAALLNTSEQEDIGYEIVEPIVISAENTIEVQVTPTTEDSVGIPAKIEEVVEIEETVLEESSGTVEVTEIPSCDNSLSGASILCRINEIRKIMQTNALYWNDSSSQMAYWYAYCLETTQFSETNPHIPSEEIKSSLSTNGYSADRGSFGAEVIAHGYVSAEQVVNAWSASPSHAQYIMSSLATSFGIGVYGSWVVGYVQ